MAAALNLNRERRALLTAIGAGRVYRSETGAVQIKKAGPEGYNRRCDSKVRELQQHGLVTEDLALTHAGRQAASGGA
jgi:hypothetical protein